MRRVRLPLGLAWHCAWPSEHMLSWESWCIKTAKEHQARIDWKEKFKAENVDTAMASALDALRTYEAGREEQLSTRG